jgi:hypothetical protein
LASKKTAALLTVIAGVFYIIGGTLLAGLIGLVSSLGSGFGSTAGSNFLDICASVQPFPCNTNSTFADLGNFGGLGSGLGVIADIILAVGVVSGGLIIFGGWLINSESSDRRKAGAILAIVVAIAGALTTFGGLIIGFILAAVGVYLALTYKASRSSMTIPFGPMASVTLGPQTIPPAAQSNVPAGSGPLNYCIKCGSPIREGAVFCGACGTRLTD